MSGLRIEIDGRRDELSPRGKFAGIPRPLGVPSGVPVERIGIFGSGGVPVNCARSSRAEGEPDMPVMLGLSSALSAGVRELAMSNAFDGEGFFDDDMTTRERERWWW